MCSAQSHSICRMQAAPRPYVWSACYEHGEGVQGPGPRGGALLRSCTARCSELNLVSDGCTRTERRRRADDLASFFFSLADEQGHHTRTGCRFVGDPSPPPRVLPTEAIGTGCNLCQWRSKYLFPRSCCNHGTQRRVLELVLTLAPQYVDQPSWHRCLSRGIEFNPQAVSDRMPRTDATHPKRPCD